VANGAIHVGAVTQVETSVAADPVVGFATTESVAQPAKFVAAIAASYVAPIPEFVGTAVVPGVYPAALLKQNGSVFAALPGPEFVFAELQAVVVGASVYPQAQAVHVKKVPVPDVIETAVHAEQYGIPASVDEPAVHDKHVPLLLKAVAAHVNAVTTPVAEIVHVATPIFVLATVTLPTTVAVAE